MKSFIEGLVELAYFALLYDHLVASVMKLAISVIESAFRLHSDSAILSAVSVMIFANFGSTNNLFPKDTHSLKHERMDHRDIFWTPVSIRNDVNGLLKKLTLNKYF